jgi:geranylgeranyl pyrophosphate synthase
LVQRRIGAALGRPSLSDADVADIQQVIIDTGALADLEASITSLTDEAIAAAHAADITTEARDELVALAYYVSWRQV